MIWHAEMSAQSTGISSCPHRCGIASYGDQYDAAYCIVQIADKLNGSYELAEVMIIDDYTDDDNVYLTEFGNVKVGTAFAGLGTISGRRTSDNVTEITFVPNAGIGVSITTFLNSLRVEEILNCCHRVQQRGWWWKLRITKCFIRECLCKL